MPSTLRPRAAVAPSSLLVVPLVVAVLAAALPDTAGAAPPPTYRPPVDAPVSDPFRAAVLAVRAGPPRPRVRHRTRAPRSAPPPTVGSPSRARWRAPATSRSCHAGRAAHHRVVPRHGRGGRRAAGRGRATGSAPPRAACTSAPARVMPTSIPPRCSSSGPPQVWLVPFDRPPGLGLAGERSAIRQLLGLGSGVLHLAGAGGRAAATSSLRMAAHYTPLGGARPCRTVALVVTTVDVLAAAWAESHRPCTADGVEVAPPAERRAAVLVGGLGSTSEHASVDDVDVAALGYDADDVVRFSYAGGRTPRSTGHPAGVAVPPVLRGRLAAGPVRERAPPRRPRRAGRRGPPGHPRRPDRPLAGRDRRPARARGAAAAGAAPARSGCWPPSARPTEAPTSPPPPGRPGSSRAARSSWTRPRASPARASTRPRPRWPS